MTYALLPPIYHVGQRLPAKPQARSAEDFWTPVPAHARNLTAHSRLHGIRIGRCYKNSNKDKTFCASLGGRS